MKKIDFCVLLGTVLLLLASPLLPAQNADDAYYSGQIWVHLNPETTAGIPNDQKSVKLEDFIPLIGADLAERYGVTEVRKPFYFARSTEITEVFEIHFPAGNEAALILELSRLPLVNYAERVPVMRTTLVPNDLGPQSGNNNQYGLWRINAQAAWDISTGSTDITVAIVDDAVLVTHPDLIPNLVAGYDVSQGNNNPMPNDPGMTHGTHVAGIVGAATNNGIGVASIGFNIKIMPVKSSNSPQFVTDAYAGVIWAADNGAHVINMSWGGSGFSQTGQNIINYAFNAGCLNVAAAGNDDVNTVFYPAGYSNVLSVASTTTTDAKSGFSNFGTWVDISAPGTAILSTYHNNYQPSYTNLSGTSMASPMVAGLAGLVLSVNPDLPQAQVVDCILGTADNIDQVNSAYIGQLGSGRINAHAAVLCAQATLTAPPIAAINAQNQVVCPGSVVQFFGSSTGGLATGYSWSFPGGNPSTSLSQNPLVVYSEAGTYDVTLSVSNDYGDSEFTFGAYMEVSQNGMDIFYIETFENGTLPGLGWTVVNPDNGVTWGLFDVAGTTSGTKAAGINLYNYTSVGARDGLVSPSLDFSNHANVVLDFQHAHRRRNANLRDSLIVYVSTDGGVSFPHRIFSIAENGQGTFATGVLLNQNFVPTNGADWCFGGDVGSGCFTLDLSDFDGESDVKIKFETYNNGGNNIYIDNVQLSGNCLPVAAPPVAGISANSTGICTGGSIQFIDQSANVPTAYLWEFEGGTPSSSTLAVPLVGYDTAGVFGVSLTVTNAYGTDVVVLESYVTVGDVPEVGIEASTTEVCAGESVTLTGLGADTYTWSPPIGISSATGTVITATPPASITYQVSGSVNGCSASASIAINVLPAPPAPTVVSGNQTSFVVLQPAAVQGHYVYAPTGAGWSAPPLGSVSIETGMVIARDATVGDSLLCNTSVNAAAIAGKIAVVYRGGCEFGTKAFNAQNAGAVGVIVVNNQGGALLAMAPGAQGAGVTIPAVMVSNTTGAWLNAALNSGTATGVLGQFNGGALAFCPDQTPRLAAPGGESTYSWSNGHSSAVIEIDAPGSYSITFGNGVCNTSSTSFSATMYDVVQPIITLEGAFTLAVNNTTAVSYQWFINGNPILGATGSSHEATADGVYTVATTDANGCTSFSEPVELVVVSALQSDAKPQGLQVFPVPSRDRVNIIIPSTNALDMLTIYTVDGRRVWSKSVQSSDARTFDIDISSWSPGAYIVQAVGKDGVLQARMMKVD